MFWVNVGGEKGRILGECQAVGYVGEGGIVDPFKQTSGVHGE